jgi:hypothetical protein
VRPSRDHRAHKSCQAEVAELADGSGRLFRIARHSPAVASKRQWSFQLPTCRLLRADPAQLSNNRGASRLSSWASPMRSPSGPRM